MATIVLSAVGAAAGAAVGGSVLGLSSVVIGRAIGATIGRAIDQSVMGAGSQAVETGKIDRFRLSGASEGAPVTRLWGRVRVAGQVIWASRFLEGVNKRGGGKGGPPTPKVKEYSYTVSVAIALCEGEITRVGRVWADGIEISPDSINMRVYTGSADQLPDPKIEAVEGAGQVPAYRGIAYVVLEDLDLGTFGNRVPQFSFEVIREAEGSESSLAKKLKGVALIPGTGEYALATTPVHYSFGPGANRSANMNSPSGLTDFATSLTTLNEELPECGSAVLVTSWFGNDLRCGECSIQPKVEQKEFDGAPMRWCVSGLDRASAEEISRVEGRTVYGGTPSDLAVIEALRALDEAGKQAVFYPFVLMDQLDGNGLPDPYGDEAGQPAFPWRGRITTSVAPGGSGSPDRTAAAVVEVAAFFGNAQPSDFSYSVTEETDTQPFFSSGEKSVVGTVEYTGPEEWSYRRFILHYAHLCAQAGNVSAFCIGSEMRGLTQIRDAEGGFPAVQALRQLAADVREILGPDVKIGYAADWSEYFGYHPADGSGDVYFHLDPLWSDPNVDFIGIDNYMPLADWRDGDEHADAHWGSIYSNSYLQSNIEGGEGFDWYYPSEEAEASQRRIPIEDGAHGEDWVYRYKDIRNWWLNTHHDRIGGERQTQPTAWVPQSKPIWFTEFGCAAIDKGANQPNRFLDPKSSESALPKFSSGRRDDLMQAQYLNAVVDYWSNPEHNPVSAEYGGRMIDMSRAHAWAWDTRPYPQFPAQTELWSDGENYDRGHWLNGRVSAQPLSAVIGEICRRAGVQEVETTALHGLVRGYAVPSVDTARSVLQPLSLTHGFDAAERDGRLVFSDRPGNVDGAISTDQVARLDRISGSVETLRTPEAETLGRVRLTYIEAEGYYQARVAEAIFPDERTTTVSATEFPLVMTSTEGRAVAERWLAEARVARDRARFALPLSQMALGAGDLVELPREGVVAKALYRIDRVEHGETRLIEAVRVERNVYDPSDVVGERVSATPFVAPVPVLPVFLDLPLLRGDEIEHAPHLALSATPWPGVVSVFSSAKDGNYELNQTVTAPSVVGVTQNALFKSTPGLLDRGNVLRVRLMSGSLASVDIADVLNGANAAAIGDGRTDNWEVFQFSEARLVGEDTYELTMFLRGQSGTDAIMPDAWPQGSLVVLLDGTAQQIVLPASARDLARHYRIGPAGRAYTDPSYAHVVAAFKGVGLRPYAPCHLRHAAQGDDHVFEWVRRTRVDGDSWSSTEVPLGETEERYLVRVLGPDDGVVREVTVTSPKWVYVQADRIADETTGIYTLSVAQVSDRFGPGPFAVITIGT